MNDIGHDSVTRWLAASAVALLLFILIWALTSTVGRPTLDERLTHIEDQFTFVTCLLLIPDEERAERGIANCQITPEGD